MVKMRVPFTQKFYEAYNDGFNDYINGRWESAMHKLEAMEKIRG